MDPGRYGLQQGWEHNSALEGYGAVHDSSFRAGVSYDDRRFVDERFSRDNVYPRGSLHRDMLERDSYPPPHSTANMWPQTRRRSYEEEYSIEKDYRRHEKLSCDDGFDRPARYGARDRDDYAYDDYDYDYRSRASHHGREDSHERNYDYGRQSYDSDYDKDDRREGNWRRRESRDRERDKRGPSWERDGSPYGRHEHSRSRSHGRDDRARSRSPLGRNHGRSHREDSYDDSWHGRDRHRNHNDRYHHDQYSVAPSATVVAKGLSPKTTEEDLYQILAEWGPLRHVRVIKERNSGISRGFAFIDFPSVDAAQAMMDRLGDDGLLVDGRKLFFEYSSKPTGMAGGSIGVDTAPRSGHGNRKSVSVPSDWMCTICGCINFARRTFCFQCNEPRTEDAPPADMTSSNPAPIGKKGEAGPTYVLVVRGLDENADEEMLRYEFSKHAPIKDLRLVRDKFTHVSRGFAFVHFYSVEDATKALDATNGTTLEKNGQILRVAYAKSIIGPGSTASGASQSSSLAAAAIEAATFAQQYDAVGWAPKEYNPDDKQSSGGQEQGGVSGQNNSAPPQSGFVWDEASGYYFDAASGFYYDGNTGLYYDGNNSAWYSFDHTTQQYVPCTNQSDETTEKQIETSKASDGSSSSRKVVISAPAATITANEKSASLPDAVQAAAAAAIAAEKKEKEKLKEIRLASKSSILANKKKMNNVLSIWKQRSHEGQAPRVALDDNQLSISAEEKAIPASSTKNKLKNEVLTAKENAMASSGFTMSAMTQSTNLESQEKARSVTTSSAGTLKGVIRGSGLRVVKSDTLYTSSAEVPSTSSISTFSAVSSSTVADMSATVAPFRTDASALGSYAQPVASGSKRRFSEMPSSSVLNKEQSQSTYRDRAAERRNLYSSSAFGDDISTGVGDSNRDSTYKRGVGVMASMPFPPGVGGGRVTGDLDSQSYDIITADRAIDESNVGNRMLRNMGWHEGLGLGKDGSGMVEPVQAQTMETRAGLGSQPKKVDPNLEVQAGDSYKAVIQKKAIARFREMS